MNLNKTWADTLNLDQMYRVRGRRELFQPLSQIGTNGHVVLGEWLNWENKITVELKMIDCIGQKTIPLSDGGELNIVDVFNNLWNYNRNYSIHAERYESLMSIMAPKYHVVNFKPYMAKQILGWYLQVVVKIQEQIMQ